MEKVIHGPVERFDWILRYTRHFFGEAIFEFSFYG